MTTKAVRVPVWFFLATALLGCASDPGTQISQSALMEDIKAGNSPIIIDVRSREEYESGHVPGAMHIPFRQANGRSTEIKAMGRLIVIYCELGPRAALAKRAFGKAGVKGILTLEGHMSAWRKAGLPIEPDPTGGGSR